jgi:hypothetical protein
MSTPLTSRPLPPTSASAAEPAGRRFQAFARTLAGLAVAIVLGVGAVLAFVHPRYLIGTLVGDDAGYYLAIARNVCLGHGFSFDRIELTNGFNPLLPALLIPLDRVLAPGLDLVACFRIGALVTWAALAWALFPAHRLATRALATWSLPAGVRALGAAALLFFLASFVALKGYYGMDAFLTLAFGLAYLAAVAEHGPLAPGARATLRDALLLAGAVLARVDTLPLAAAAFLVMSLFARREAGDMRRLAARAAIFLAAIVPCLVWNRIVFGDWLPISARLKSSFPHWDPAASLQTVFHTSLNPADAMFMLLALALAVAWIAWKVLARGQDEWRAMRPGDAALSILALALAGRIGWLLLFSRLDVQGSYFILAHPFVALGLLLLAARFAGSRGVALAAALLILAGLGLLAAKLQRAVPDVRAIAAGNGDEWEIARRVHDLVRPDQVLYGGAFGLIGYIADRAWINGDGVANTRAYQEAIRDHQLERHLAERSVDYVVVTANPPRDPGPEPLAVSASSPLFGAVDSTQVQPSDIVLSERMRRGGGTAVWVARWNARSPADQASPVPSLPQPSR